MTENLKHMREIVEYGLANAPVQPEALAVLDLLGADVRAAKQEEESSDRLRRTLADILTETANILKGPPGELKEHSWHDIPDKVLSLVAVSKCLADLTAILDFDKWNELYIYPNGGDGNYGVRFIADDGEGPLCMWRRIGRNIPFLLAELREWVEKQPIKEIKP